MRFRFLLSVLVFLTISFICYSNYSILFKARDFTESSSIILANFLPQGINIFNKSNQNLINSTILNSNQSLKTCPLIPPNLGTRINVNLEKKSLNDLEEYFRRNLKDLKLGGYWSPSQCKSRHKIAIIIPYRDRLSNLELFLLNMHPFLSKQQLEYAIYVIEPAANLVFNRGFLMNIGYVEALKERDWLCFAFHDVDLLPEDERNIYSCPETPRHMSSAVSTLKYRLPYEKIFGGVTSFTKEQFQKINGFSNLFFGWGGEDDDLRERVVKKGYVVSRYPLDIGRYYMASHAKDKPNPERFNLLKTSDKRIDHEGVNSLEYDVLSITKTKLFTKIIVTYDKEAIIRKSNITVSSISKTSITTTKITKTTPTSTQTTTSMPTLQPTTTTTTASTTTKNETSTAKIITSIKLLNTTRFNLTFT